MKSLIAAFIVLLSLSLTPPVDGQDTAELQATYDAKLATWRETIKQVRSVGISYLDAEDASTAKEFRKEWAALRTKGRAEVKEVIAAAADLYAVKPSSDLSDFLQRVMGKFLDDGQPEKAYRLGQMLLKNDPKNEPMQIAMASAAIKTNRFEEAAQFSEQNGQLVTELGLIERELFDLLGDLRAKHQRELELQAAEAKTDDLPRVRFTTTKGDIVVELFENEAPATVANIISLVEAGKYSNMMFHRVIKDFMAQTGEKYKDGQYSSVGYTIYDECKEEDARFHFRGSLSMANTGQPNSGNIQFFFCHRSLPHLDGLHTVFGRIVSGMDVFEEISLTHYIGEKGDENAMENPTIDHIISAEVIRKRDHAYEVQKAVGN